MLAISLLAIFGSLSTLALPWLAGLLLEDVLAFDAQSDSLVVIGLVGFLLSSTILSILAAVLSTNASCRIMADLRAEAFAHIQHLPMSFHDRSRQGDLLALLSYEVANLSHFLTSTLASVPAMLLTAGGSVVLLFLIDPVMALFVPVMVPVFWIFMKLAGRRLRIVSRRAQRAEASLLACAEAQLEMLPAIKAFAVEEHRGSHFAELVENSRVQMTRRTRLSAIMGPLVGLVAAVAAVIIVLAGMDRFGSEENGAAELFSFLLYAALLTRPVGSLAEFYGQYQMAKGALARLGAVFSRHEEQGYTATGTLPQPVRGEIAFRDLDFSYQGREGLLAGVNLSIAAGEILAITGENGAGKSTLINLLMGFYAPQAGTITLDGCDIATLQVQHLRRHVGLVPQRALLINGSIRENILFGNPDAGDEALEQALRLSQAKQFIDELPRGLDTEIGDHGVRLSGGQRQRIALARALVTDPPILVFDEATSMYDLEGEAAFVEACRTALKGRTVLIITHRPASLDLADRVVVVADGKVSEA